MPSKHAKVGPSSMKKRIHCAGSLRMEKKAGNPSSDASAKGTGVHAALAKCLKEGIDPQSFIGWYCGEFSSGEDYLSKVDLTTPATTAKGLRVFPFTRDDANSVQIVVDLVEQLRKENPDAFMEVEQKITILDDICWGTGDIQLKAAFGPLWVIDYKNGFVEATFEQLMTYAYGAVTEGKRGRNPNDYSEARMIIVQPNSLGEDVTEVVMTIKDLMKWGEDVLFPAIEACLKPNAPLTPGSWCKDAFCSARAICPAKLQQANEIGRNMFAVIPTDRPKQLPTAKEIDPEQRRIILDKADEVIDFINQVKEYEYAQAMRGLNTWGKLVRGNKSKSFTRPEAAESFLSQVLGEAAYKKELLTPAAAVREFKARKMDLKRLTDLITEKDGKLTLVPVSHKKAAVNPADFMFKDLSDN